MAHKTIIIAEAGVNHNGQMSIAKELIEVAADAGCDFVKFQTFKAKNLAHPEAQKARYQQENTGGSENQTQMLEKLELSEGQHHELIEHCKLHKIKFLSTAFDKESVDFLNDHIPLFKIPSGEITNIPLIRYIAQKNKPIILSTGMATLDEIREACLTIHENTKVRDNQETPSLTIMHCTTAYPTPLDEVNLLAMNIMEQEFSCPIGYSDHTLGLEASLAAVAKGATIIEKHFTVSRSLEGPDHKASLEPSELKELVSSIRTVEKVLGLARKEPTKSEVQNKKIARKSLYFAKDLQGGHVLKQEDLLILRPEGGLHPRFFDELLGKKILTSSSAYSPIMQQDIDWS